MKTHRLLLLLGLLSALASANTAPTPVIVSAAMRPGTTYLDVVFRVNDPDDATVQVRALAFISGTRSFANVIRPAAFVGDTTAVLGAAVPANTDRTLTWDVAADWNVELGQLKFEILALDGRGLLAFDWIIIPAAGDFPELTISKDTPPDAKVLDALFWEYAGGGDMVVKSGSDLRAGEGGGLFKGLTLASGAGLTNYARPFLLSRMDLSPASEDEMRFAQNEARAGLLNAGNWHAIARPDAGMDLVVGWGQNYGHLTSAPGVVSVADLTAGRMHTLVLTPGGVVLAWGTNYDNQCNVPAGLKDVASIGAGPYQSYAVTHTGVLHAWGRNQQGALTIPENLGPVRKAVGGEYHTLVLKSDGAVAAWGHNGYGQGSVPPDLSDVTDIAAGYYHNIALKSDGTVVAWGRNYEGQCNVPAGLAGVVAIATDYYHCLALRADGTVVAWGQNNVGQCNVPADLGEVVAIAAGVQHSMALKADGTVVIWGGNSYGEHTPPVGMRAVRRIAASNYSSFAIVSPASGPAR